MNLSLSRDGAYGLELGHARYVLVGLAFAVLLAFPLAFSWQTGVVLAAALAHAGVRSAVTDFVGRVLALVFLAVIFALMVLRQIPLPPAFVEPIEASTWLTWLLLTLLLGLALGHTYASSRIVARPAGDIAKERVELLNSTLALSAFACVALGAIVVSTYTDNLFPRLSRYWGGGSAELVEVWPSKETSALFAQAVGATGTNESFVVCLVDETATSYLIRSRVADTCGRGVITVTRSNIVAVVPRLR